MKIRTGISLIAATLLTLSVGIPAEAARPKPALVIEQLGDSNMIIQTAPQMFSWQMLIRPGFIFQSPRGCLMYQRKYYGDDPDDHPLSVKEAKPTYLVFPKGSRLLRFGTTVSVKLKPYKLGENVGGKLGIGYYRVITGDDTLPEWAGIKLSCRPGIGDEFIVIDGM